MCNLKTALFKNKNYAQLSDPLLNFGICLSKQSIGYLELGILNYILVICNCFNLLW